MNRSDCPSQSSGSVCHEVWVSKVNVNRDYIFESVSTSMVDIDRRSNFV